MSNLYRLKKELAFWQRVHEHEPVDEIELRLESQIRQLENPDELGRSRFNGHIEEEEYEEPYIPNLISCKYCGKNGLRWVQVNGRWKLAELSGLHVCEDDLSCFSQIKS